MMFAQTLLKWDYEAHSYKPFYVPAHWDVTLYSEDMSKEINCASCGEVLPYGESYVSLEIHNPMGFGFAVCGKCYNEEYQRRRKYELLCND